MWRARRQCEERFRPRAEFTEPGCGLSEPGGAWGIL